MKTYKYILLDWDGCLAKTLDIWLDTYKQIFAEYNLYPEDRVITQEVFGDWNGPAKLGIENIEEYSRRLTATVEEKYPHAKLYPGVKEVLETLRRDKKLLALITTTKRSTLLPALESNKIVDAFDLILCAEDVTRHKPDPEVIHKALHILNGNKDQSIIIGDSKSDLGAAQNASIDSILYYPQQNELFYDLENLKTYHPTYIVKDFLQVLDIVG